jgi:hypothetical protein
MPAPVAGLREMEGEMEEQGVGYPASSGLLSRTRAIGASHPGRYVKNTSENQPCLGDLPPQEREGETAGSAGVCSVLKTTRTRWRLRHRNASLLDFPSARFFVWWYPPPEYKWLVRFIALLILLSSLAAAARLYQVASGRLALGARTPGSEST